MIERAMFVREPGSSDEAMCMVSSSSPSGDLKVAEIMSRSLSGADARFELFNLRWALTVLCHYLYPAPNSLPRTGS